MPRSWIGAILIEISAPSLFYSHMYMHVKGLKLSLFFNSRQWNCAEKSNQLNPKPSTSRLSIHIIKVKISSCAVSTEMFSLWCRSCTHKDGYSFPIRHTSISSKILLFSCSCFLVRNSTLIYKIFTTKFAVWCSLFHPWGSKEMCCGTVLISGVLCLWCCCMQCWHCLDNLRLVFLNSRSTCVSGRLLAGFQKWAFKMCYGLCSNGHFIRQHDKDNTIFFKKLASARCPNTHLFSIVWN